MTVPLYGYESPDGVEVLVTWNAPLVAPGCCQDEKPNGSPLPFIRIMRAGGTDDGLCDKGKYSIDVFGVDDATTQHLARQVKRRILLLKQPYGGQIPVTISTGTFYADDVKCESPKPINYVDDTIPRSMYLYQMICQLDLRTALAT